MAITVDQLGKLITNQLSSGSVTIRASDVGIPDVTAMFSAYLGTDSLTVTTQPKFDSAGLQLTGKITISHFDPQAPVTVSFTADPQRQYITGCQIEAGYAFANQNSWKINAPYLSADLTKLHGQAFTLLMMRFFSVPTAAGERDSGFLAGLAFATTGGTGTPPIVWLQNPGSSRIGMSGYFPTGFQLAGEAAVRALPFLAKDPSIVDGVLSAFSGVISSILDSVMLTQVSALYDLGLDRWDEVSVSLGLRNGLHYQIIPTLFTLDTITPLRFGASRDQGGTTWRVGCTVGARCTFGSMQLDAQLSMPERQMSAVLWNPSNANALIPNGALDGTGVSPSAHINYVHITCDANTPSAYTLALGLQTNWDLGGGVQMTDVEMRLSGQSGQPLATVELAGRMSLRNSSLIVSGTKSGSAWTASGSGFDIKLADFETWFNTTFGTPLPSGIAGLDIDRVSVSLSHSAGWSGSVSSSGSFPISNTTTADLSLDAHIGNGATNFTGKLTLMS